MQRVHLVTGAKNICAQIDSRLESWNKGKFDELVGDSYAATKGYLGREHRNQSANQRHHKFSTFVIRGKLRETVRFV